MKNKLKLVLWGKKLELPENYDNLEFDKYELNLNILSIYKNNEVIKLIWYWENGNKYHEINYKNGKLDGKQYWRYEDGKLMHEFNYKNGKNMENNIDGVMMENYIMNGFLNEK